MREQIITRLFTKAPDINGGALRERGDRAYRMDAADETSYPFERGAILQLRCSSTAPLVHREAKAGEARERAAIRQPQRCDNRNLDLRKFKSEAMFLEDLRVGPSVWTVELGDDASGPRLRIRR